MNMEIAERESKRKMSQIDDETYMHHEKALTDADAYRRAKTAEGNAAVFTEAYLKVRFQAAALSSEFFFFSPCARTVACRSPVFIRDVLAAGDDPVGRQQHQDLFRCVGT